MQTKRKKMTAMKKVITCSLLTILRSRSAFILIVVALGAFALSPAVHAVIPAPDGGYPVNNTAEGDFALFNLTTGVGNTAVGNTALAQNTTGRANTATGNFALQFNKTANDNTATGSDALRFNTTGRDNTANGSAALIDNTIGNNNTATGSLALRSSTTASFNTANGFAALFSNTTGDVNTATGFQALNSNTTGSLNTANGVNALLHNTTGGNNTANGEAALQNNTIGGGNIALGFAAGLNRTTGSNNIDIGSRGVAAESATMRIGTTGIQTRTFIAGVRGAAVAGSTVVVNASGQFGTAASSERFKDEIKPMNKASEAILGLQPVTFRYKKNIDPDRIPQFGLLAEDVDKVNPDLVVRDKEGKPYSVRYDQVNAMLLNQFLKEHRKVEQQEASITQLKSTVAKHEAAIAGQQAGMQAVTTRLNEQVVQIQKVSAQLEASKPAPQVVNNP
jgi:trimeric autotransporter adhesin